MIKQFSAQVKTFRKKIKIRNKKAPVGPLAARPTAFDASNERSTRTLLPKQKKQPAQRQCIDTYVTRGLIDFSEIFPAARQVLDDR